MNKNIAEALREDLGYLLPKSILDELDEKGSGYSSPFGTKNCHENDQNLNYSNQFTFSPYIPPESRLSSYINKKQVDDDIAKPCNLSKFFNDMSISDEIQNTLKNIPQRVKLYKHFKENKFFLQVKENIEEHCSRIQPKLNSYASSFIPDYDKENTFPIKKSSLKY